MTFNIERLNLFEDFAEIKKADLIARGFGIDDSTESENIVVEALTLELQQIPQKERTIFKSSTFICPSGLAANLLQLEEKIRVGEALRPYQSKSVGRLGEKDGLLFDWDIYHLHLGSIITNGFVDRTGPLLFVRFYGNNAYFIGIWNHGEWARQEMIKIIHDNWPETIAKYKLNDVLGVGNSFSDQDVLKLRDAQINTALEIAPGIVYLGPGGGITASGDNVKIIMKLNDIRRTFDAIEEDIENELYKYIEHLKAEGWRIENSALSFRLQFKDGQMQIFENNNGFTLDIKTSE